MNMKNICNLSLKQRKVCFLLRRVQDEMNESSDGSGLVWCVFHRPDQECVLLWRNLLPRQRKKQHKVEPLYLLVKLSG